ncbi:MAG TPA: Na+/H+ antiporter subunit C [Geminicoccaceae bacterium]|nr:Na+/H+ antiporter subunit C [Geminicoccaceae bacterium]
MELLVASGVGVMTATGVYLTLRGRSFAVVLGLALLSYAVNVFLFAMGRLVVNLPPVIRTDAPGYADPLPQALVLTAIVISFGMTALLVVLALRGFLEVGDDHVDLATVERDRRMAQGEPATRSAAAQRGATGP